MSKEKEQEKDVKLEETEGSNERPQIPVKDNKKEIPLNENAIIEKLKDIENKLESFEIDLSDDDKDDDKKKGAIDIALGIIVLLAGIGALIFYTKGVNNGENKTKDQ